MVVRHDILVHGVGMQGAEQKKPILLQMHDDDFPARFLQDLANPDQPSISTTTILNTPSDPLFQPVQRMLNVALVKLSCNSLSYPRVDPTRILSAGLVIRRVVRKAGINGGAAIEDPGTLAAWMRSASGQFQWVTLTSDQENLDPDPTLRPQLASGQLDLDRQLSALTLATAQTESTTPAFAVPPATSAKLCRTVVYAVVPTASSEVSDVQPKQPPLIDKNALTSALPGFLRCSSLPPTAPLPGASIDFRWMSDDFLNTAYPPTISSTPSASQSPVTPNGALPPFRLFTTSLLMLHSVFNAFGGTPEGQKILDLLNQQNVTFGTGSSATTQAMGDFFKDAKACLLDRTTSSLLMPTSWDAIGSNASGGCDLVDALVAALTPQSKAMLAPQGRFQDATRQYRLRLFFRIKGETPTCPPELVWSHYSDPFRIAAWHEGSQRSHPPVPLPDITTMNLKPNCSFQVPGSLMGAMQGASMSGLMNGSGGGSGMSLDWICGFNIPLITICAFFVLNIFLSLLNIVFFWLPFIKICIPFPMPSPAAPDEGTP